MIRKACEVQSSPSEGPSPGDAALGSRPEKVTRIGASVEAAAAFPSHGRESDASLAARWALACRWDSGHGSFLLKPNSQQEILVLSLFRKRSFASQPSDSGSRAWFLVHFRAIFHSDNESEGSGVFSLIDCNGSRGASLPPFLLGLTSH